MTHIAMQFSVTSVNRPGRLAAVLDALRKEKVDLLAMSVMDSAGRGTLRFVPDDPALASSALEVVNASHERSEVVMVDLPNQAGALAHVCERLAGEHLEMSYCYSGTRSGKGGGTAVVKVNNVTRAVRVLSENNSTGKKEKPHRRPLRAR